MATKQTLFAPYRREVIEDPLEGEARPPVTAGEFEKGLVRGGKSLKAHLQEAGALATGVVGAEETQRELEEAATTTLRGAQPFAPRVRSLAEAETAGDVVDFLVGGTAESIPYLGETVLSAAAARFGLGKAFQLGRKGKQVATGAGAFAGIAVPETGITSREIREETGERDPLLATGAGLAKGALDVYSLGKAARTFLPGKGGQALRSRLAEIPKAAVREGITEAAQEGIDIGAVRYAKEDFAPLTQEEFQRGLDAAVLGATAGGVFAGAGVGTRAAVDRFFQAPDQASSQSLRDAIVEAMGPEQADVFAQQSGYDSMDDMQSAWDRGEFDGTEIPLETDDLFFDQQEEIPWPSLDTWREAGVTQAEDKLATQLDELNTNDPIIQAGVKDLRDSGATDEEIQAHINASAPFERVSYYDTLKERSEETGEVLELAMAEAAQRIVGRFPKLQKQLDKLGTEEFLKRMEHIRKSSIPGALGKEFMFTNEELNGVGGDAKTRHQTAILRKPGYSKTKGEQIPATKSGDILIRIKSGNQWQTKSVNLHALVKAQRRRGTHNLDVSKAEQIGQMLAEGLSTIANMEGVEAVDFGWMNQLTPKQKHQMVVFNEFREGEPSRAITLAEVEATGKTSRAMAREIANEVRLQKAYRYMEHLQNQENRLQSLAEQLVTDEALLENTKELKKVQDEYKRIRKGVPTLEQDLEAARAEVARARTAVAAEVEEEFFDPTDVEQITGRETGEPEPAKKRPIYRGYAAGETPNAENLFNFGVREELFETAVSDEDAKTVTERWYEYYLSLKNLHEAVAATNRVEYLDAVYESTFKGKQPPERMGFEAKKKFLLNHLRNKVVWANNELAEKRHEERAQILRYMDGIKAQGTLHFSPSTPLPEGWSGINWAENEQFQRVQSQFNTWVEQLGLADKVVLITPNQALDVNPLQTAEILVGTLQGFASLRLDQRAFMDPVEGIVQNKHLVYVNPFMPAEEVMTALAHEIGHTVLFEALSSDITTGTKIVQEFESWRAKHKRPSSQYAELLKERGESVHIMLAAMRRTTMAQAKEHNPSHVMYLTEFSEWFADRVRNRLMDPTPPKGAVAKFFDRTVEGLREVFNLTRPPERSVEEYVDVLLRKSKGTGWDSPRAPHQVMQAWLDEIGETMPASETEQLRFNEALFEELSAYMERVTGKRITQFDADFLAELANMQQHDAMGRAFNMSFRYGAQVILNTEERAALSRAATSAHVTRQLARLLKEQPQAWEEVQSDPEAAIAYTYQFWMSGQITLGPQTVSTFQKIYDFLIDLLGIVTDSENAERIFDRFAAGDALQRKENANDESVSYVKQASRDTRIQRVAHDTLGPAWEKVANTRFGKALFSAATSRMHDSKNAYIRKIANTVYARVGTQFEKEDMLTARTREMGKFATVVRKIFEGKSQEHGQRVIEILNSGRDIDPNTTDVYERDVLRVRNLMNVMHEYFKEAGLDVPYVKNYFPWVLDQEYMRSNRDQLVEFFKHPNFKRYFREGYTPERLVNVLIVSGGYADTTINPNDQSTPQMSAMNTRTLKWIDENATPEQRAEWGKYLSKDIGHTLITYIEQGVKRAEYHRRFGKDGVNVLLGKAEQYGATDEDIELAREFMDAVMGTAGYGTNVKLHKLLGLEPPPPGEIINPKLQRLMGIVMVYQNVRVLSLATLTSLADPVGIAVRSGEFGIAWNALREGVRASVSHAQGNREVLVDLAEMLGVADRNMTVEALNWEYGGVFITGWERRVNEEFFKWTGLQGWTRMTRVMGLEGGMRFIRRHVQNPNEHSERFLAELNLRPDDVVFDAEGRVKILTSAERRAASEEEVARDDNVRAALHRFVDGAILRPNAALRPIWASDPHFMLIFHLKSFMYAFHERILKRVVHEAGNGNLAPLLMFGLFIPAMIMADFLRDILKYGLDGDPVKAQWSVTDYMARAVERSGMLGLGQIPVDASKSIQYGGVGFESFAGPTYEQIEDIFTDEDYQVSKAIPAQNLWRTWGD